MKKMNTIVAKQLADASNHPLEDKTDWQRLRAMTDE